jgi:hypothetical protein
MVENTINWSSTSDHAAPTSWITLQHTTNLYSFLKSTLNPSPSTQKITRLSECLKPFHEIIKSHEFGHTLLSKN